MLTLASRSLAYQFLPCISFICLSIVTHSFCLHRAQLLSAHLSFVFLVDNWSFWVHLCISSLCHSNSSMKYAFSILRLFCPSSYYHACHISASSVLSDKQISNRHLCSLSGFSPAPAYIVWLMHPRTSVSSPAYWHRASSCDFRVFLRKSLQVSHLSADLSYSNN